MLSDEVKDTPKELRYYVKIDIVPEKKYIIKIQYGQRACVGLQAVFQVHIPNDVNSGYFSQLRLDER